jgi:outer membrane protein
MKINRTVGVISIINLVTFLSFLIYFFFFTSYKIAYVDSNKLVNGYQGMLDARQVYQKKASAWKANIDTLTNEIQQQIFKYEKESPSMTTKERELSKELIRTKQKQLSDYQQAINNQAQQEDSKMTADVMSQINAHIKKHGEVNHYRIILAATEYGNLAYADDVLDITDDILNGLNKEYKGQ